MHPPAAGLERARGAPRRYEHAVAAAKVLLGTACGCKSQGQAIAVRCFRTVRQPSDSRALPSDSLRCFSCNLQLLLRLRSSAAQFGTVVYSSYSTGIDSKNQQPQVIDRGYNVGNRYLIDRGYSRDLVHVRVLYILDLP